MVCFLGLFLDYDSSLCQNLSCLYYLWLLNYSVGYIGEFEYVDDHRAGKIVVELNGRLNKCGVISPRFDIGVKEIEGWTARLLPSRQVGSKITYLVFLDRYYLFDLSFY